MDNHIIIGLGGTGGRVLAAYRKLVYEKFNGNLAPDDLWIRYLYVDSSASDLQMDDPKQWEVMGTSVKFDTDSVLPIKAADLATYVHNRNRYKYLAPWLGEEEQWTNIINDPKISSGAAGQKRRLGRLLFANSADRFNSVISGKVSQLKENPDGQQLTFHVIAGLAGGTGSGSVVDVVAQLRNEYPDYENYKIMLYLLLPDEYPDKRWASTDNYQPNGYVALTELNALDQGTFQPWNVGERNKAVERLKLSLPFYSAYLVTEQNQENISFNVQKVVPESIAEFIFQKTVAVERDLQDGAQTESPREFFHSAERGENPKYTDYDGQHCFKFMTYGIKRLAVPEQEIKEYYGYSFSMQALCCMLYNNLSAEMGYVNEQINKTEDNSFVLSNEYKQKWFLSRDFLCLSKPVLQAHKDEGWATIPDEFKEVDKFKVEVMNNSGIDFADKLIAIRNKSKQYYNKNFRPIREQGQNGVENFYDQKEKYGLEPIANQIMQVIEHDLFDQWVTGKKSLSQISEMIDVLISFYSEELDSLTKLKASATATIKDRNAKMESKLKEWADIGLGSKIGKWTGLGDKIDTLAAEFTIATKERYTWETWIKGYEFAGKLIEKLKTATNILKSNVNTVSENFAETVKTIIGEINSRCTDEDEETQSKNGLVIKNYDPKKTKDICKKAIAIADSNTARIAEIRIALLNVLSKDRQDFKEAKDKLSYGQILKITEKIGLSLAETFFKLKIDEDRIEGYEQLVGINIIEKLRKDFDGNPTGLKKKFDRLVKHASVLARHNPTEVNDGPTIKQQTFVVIPDFKEDQDFQKLVVDTILAASPNPQFSKVSVGGESTEIVVINLEANITPRYLRSVDVLRKKHDDLFASPQGKVARFETQLEDYDSLPSLFKKSDKELEEERMQMQAAAIPNLLFAKGMGILKAKDSKETGLSMLCYTPVDEDGLPDIENEVRLGRNLEKSVAKITPDIAQLLGKAVKELLMRDYRHVDRQAELRKSIAADVAAIMEAHDNNSEDAIVQTFSKAFKQVKNMINALNED